MVFNKTPSSFPCLSDGPSPISLKMPEKYLYNSRLFNNFRFLIHMRGFYATNCSVMFDERSSSNIQQKLGNIDLTLYEQYCKGEYFPPLKLRKSGDSNIYGTGVGVFASEAIDQFVFIGEYAGDIINENQLIITKRTDMTMDLHHNPH